MDRDFWLDRWKSHQIGFHQRHTNQLLKKYWPLPGTAPDATVLVPLCGKSLDMRWLYEQGHLVLGVEIARTAVSGFFEEWGVPAQVVPEGPYERWEGRGVTVLCGDFFDLQPQQLAAVGAVFDRAALIALPPQMRESYVRKLLATLPARTPILLITLDYDPVQMSGPPFAVADQEVHRLFAACDVRQLAEVDVSAAPDNARFRERGVSRLVERVYRIDTRD